jgi:transcriptional regulator with XRE-family HTH domain
MALPPKKARAARYLARGWTQAATAKRVGCGVRTIRAWLHEDADFQAAARDPAEAARDITVYETFQDLLTDENPLVRARAVEIALKFPADSFPREHADAVQVTLNDLRRKAPA